MADIYFSKWDDLVNAVDNKLSVILEKDVAPIAEEILKKHIKSDIYDAYTPKENGWVNGTTYQRRHVLEEAVTSIMLDKNTVLITSTATASPSIVNGWSFHNRYPGAFLKLIESGNTGIWKNGFPRPAVSNTQDEIDNSNQIASAIKRGIKREIGICIDI
ncbi:MAG: hypothetical protein IKI94_01595 [Ruminococcus sp.]|nr:hypothetical protein [Ruminococcus sp.]